MTQEQIKKIEDMEERFCYEMVNSCLTYGYSLDCKYITEYYKTLGKKRVEEICEEQKEYFKNHVIIKRNSFTDDEGLSYSSIVEY